MAFPSNIINTVSTNLPTFSVRVNGVPLDTVYGVAAITINSTVNKIPYARLAIIDGDVAKQKFAASSSELFVPGNPVEISMGYHNQNEPVFSGIIMSQSIEVIEGRPTLLMLDLKDKAVKLTVGRKNKCFYEKSDKTIIREIIGKYPGVSMDLSLPSLGDEIVHKEMVQYYCTDWDFIVSRAEAIGKLVVVHNGKIAIMEPSALNLPKLNLTFGINVYEFQAKMNAVEEYKEVTAQSWNDSTRQVAKKKSTGAPGVPDEGNISGDRLSGVIGLDSFLLQHPGKMGDAEALAWAKSKMMRSRLSKITGRTKIDGFGGIKPGDLINISKFSPRFNNVAFVSSVTHQLTSESAWYTDITFGLDQEWFTSKYQDVTDQPASGLLPAVNGLMTGIVKAITQTDTDMRVKVHVPFVNEGSEGIWARFAAPYAGQKRGIFFRPEVDDEVVIGFLNDDPREPVVLGALHSSNSKGETPVSVTTQNSVKGIYTFSGMKVEFNDEEKTLLIETPGKNKIEIKDNGSPSIAIEDKNKNKIEMSDQGITIESAAKMTLKSKDEFTIEAPSIKQTADTEFTVESSGGTLELNAGASLTIKGAKVDINPPA
jgi:Rhs element Vgr protein